MASSAHELRCARCGTRTDPVLAAQGPVACFTCGDTIHSRVFPAMWRALEVARPEQIVAGDDASCFNHPDNRAAAACQRCGRFICSLCAIPLAGQTLCPSCVEAHARGDTPPAAAPVIAPKRVLYGNMALSLALLPLLVWPLTLLTAPAALFVTLRYWRRPLSLRGGTHLPHIFALVFSLLQIAGWTFLGYRLFAGLD